MDYGSVRFFKRLICFTVAGTMTAMLCFCVFLTVQNQRSEAELEALRKNSREENPLGILQAYAGTDESLMDPDLINAAEGIPYQSLYPELYVKAPDQFVADEGVAYLTFDDGPSARTPEILAILKQYGVKATFFVIGKDDEQSKAWMRQIVEEGHTIAIHSYSHQYKEIYASVESFLADFDAMYRLIYETTGVYPTVFRFPGGSLNAYNQGIHQEITAEMLRRGFVFYDWDASTQDAAARTTADGIVESALGSASGKSRCILLAHDSSGKENTVAALPRIIEGLSQMGYAFDRLTPEVKPISFGYKTP